MGPKLEKNRNDSVIRRTQKCAGIAARDHCLDCGHDRWRWQGCGKSSCAHEGCRAKVSGRRAHRAWDKLDTFEGEPWGVVVLTIPDAVRETLKLNSCHAAVRRAAVDVVTAWARRWCFHGVDVRLGGAIVAHPCGDVETIWAPHFNVLFGLVGVTDDGAIRVGRFKVPLEALDNLRHEWGCVLVDLGWSATCSPQVFYEWRADPSRKRHALRYFLRSFPTWAAWTHRVFWWGLLAANVGWRMPGHEPTPWNDTKPVPAGLCVKCRGSTRTMETVRRGVYDVRDPVSLIWRRELDGPRGAWRELWTGG